MISSLFHEPGHCCPCGFYFEHLLSLLRGALAQVNQRVCGSADSLLLPAFPIGTPSHIFNKFCREQDQNRPEKGLTLVDNLPFRTHRKKIRLSITPWLKSGLEITFGQYGDPTTQPPKGSIKAGVKPRFAG
jgi:hypothetical protein